MPKRNWINQWINDANLQKEAGSSNGTVFLHQGEEHGSKDINDGSKTAANLQKEAGSSNETEFLHQGEEQDVDVETFCSRESSFVVDSKVQAITQRPAVYKQEAVEEDIKEPNHKGFKLKIIKEGCSLVSGSVKELSSAKRSPVRRPLSPGKATTLTIVKIHCCRALHGMQCPL